MSNNDGDSSFALNTLIRSSRASTSSVGSAVVIAWETTDMTWMTGEWMATPRKQIAMLADWRRFLRFWIWGVLNRWCLGHCLGEKIQMSVNYSIKPRSHCQKPAVTIFYWVCDISTWWPQEMGLSASKQKRRLRRDVGRNENLKEK